MCVLRTKNMTQIWYRLIYAFTSQLIKHQPLLVCHNARDTSLSLEEYINGYIALPNGVYYYIYLYI